MKQKITITLTEKILKNIDSIVDRAFIRNRSQAVEYLIERSFGQNKTAVILATGPSESLRLSKDEFRPTARIENTPTIEFAIKNLRENGFKKIFIVGEQPVLTSIFSAIGDGKRYGVSINFIEDKDPPGSGESLRLLKGELKGTFLVLYGDILFNRIDLGRIWKQHFKNRGIATAMVLDSSSFKGGTIIPIRKTSIHLEGDKITEVYSKLDKIQPENHFVLSSIFVAEPEIFSYSGNWIEKDIFPILAEKQMIYSYLSSEGEVHVHSKEDIKVAKMILAQRRSNFEIESTN